MNDISSNLEGPPSEPLREVPVGEEPKRLERKWLAKVRKTFWILVSVGGIGLIYYVVEPYIRKEEAIIREGSEINNISSEEALKMLDIKKKFSALDKDKFKSMNREVNLRVHDLLQGESTPTDFLTNLIFSRGLGFEGKQRAKDLEIDVSEFTDTDMDILFESPKGKDNEETPSWYIEQQLMFLYLQRVIEYDDIPGVDLSGIEVDGTGLATYLVKKGNGIEESAIIELLLRSYINNESLLDAEKITLRNIVAGMGFEWRSAIEKSQP